MFWHKNKNKWEALLELAFLDCSNFTISVNVLRMISLLFVKKITFSPELNFKNDSIDICLNKAEFNDLLAKISFIEGIEFIDEEWITLVFKNLNNELNRIVKKENTASSNFSIKRNRCFEIYK